MAAKIGPAGLILVAHQFFCYRALYDLPYVWLYPDLRKTTFDAHIGVVMSQHKWSRHKRFRGTIYVVILGPARPLMHWSRMPRPSSAQGVIACSVSAHSQRVWHNSQALNLQGSPVVGES